MDMSATDQINSLFNQGAVGIKFISPERPSGHDSYFLDYEGCRRGIKNMMDFYVRFMERLKIPDELRQKVYRENILMLTATGK